MPFYSLLFGMVYMYLTLVWWIKFEYGETLGPEKRTFYAGGLLLILFIASANKIDLLPYLVFSIAAYYTRLTNRYHAAIRAAAIYLVPAALLIAGINGHTSMEVPFLLEAGVYTLAAVPYFDKTGRKMWAHSIKDTLQLIATILRAMLEAFTDWVGITQSTHTTPNNSKTGAKQNIDYSHSDARHTNGDATEPEASNTAQTHADKKTKQNGTSEDPNSTDGKQEQAKETHTSDRPSNEGGVDGGTEEQDNTDMITTGEESGDEANEGGFHFDWEEPPNTSFADIGGYNEVKTEIEDTIIAPLKSDNSSFDRFGVDPSRGCLFYGPPGTGKTLFARALASELGRPFIELTQADLTHHHINKSPQLIQRVFEEGDQLGAVVFIDEAEQLLGDRSVTDNHQEDDKITNTFLSVLTQDDRDSIVILTTNKKDEMDNAVLRPGRIDEKIKIGLPGRAARQEIIGVKTNDIPTEFTKEGTVELLDKTKGLSGAEIEAVINRAKMRAAKEGLEYITAEELVDAYNEMNF